MRPKADIRQDCTSSHEGSAAKMHVNVWVQHNHITATCSVFNHCLLHAAEEGCKGCYRPTALLQGCTLSFHLCVQPVPEARNGRQCDQRLHVGELCEHPLRNLLDQEVAQVNPCQPLLSGGNGIEHSCIRVLGFCDLSGCRLCSLLLCTWGHTALQSSGT